MGNHRFRLSDMMPNAWFYKLKDMSRRTRKNKSPNTMKQSQSSPTASQKSHLSHRPNFPYYFTTNPTMSERVGVGVPASNPRASRTYVRDPQRKSSKKRGQRKTIYMPSPKLVSYVSDDLVSPDHLPNESPDYFVSSAESDFHELCLSESETDNFAAPSPFDGRVTSSTTDIIIDMNDDSFAKKAGKLNGDDTISELELPPILTKPEKFNNNQADRSRSSSKWKDIKARRSFSVQNVKEESIRTNQEERKDLAVRKSSANSGIRLRANSPKIANKKLQASARKSVSSKTRMKVRNKSISESFAIVKSSFDPQRDFRDSMMEMIMENNIWESKDLEDLLACYLSLNSNEYHGIIIKAFEQIWLDLTHSQL